MTDSAPTCRCAQGWICEAHPELPWPHDDCPGPGMRCQQADCPWWRGPKPAALDTSEWTIHASTDMNPHGRNDH